MIVISLRHPLSECTLRTFPVDTPDLTHSHLLFSPFNNLFSFSIALLEHTSTSITTSTTYNMKSVL
jgi:hypothetical protein